MTSSIPTITFPTTKELTINIKKALHKDNILMTRSKVLTEKLLDCLGNKKLHVVVNLVRDYQKKYLLLKDDDKALSNLFTIELWWDSLNINIKK